MAEGGNLTGVAMPELVEANVETNIVENNIANASPSLEERIQAVLDGYRPTLYMDGGDVQLLRVDEKGIAHVKMLGACIDCPISVLTMKLGIQRLLKENFSEIRGVNAITDIDISALYNRRVDGA
jgi:Fe-S cluster biogenesis protein NfuA